MAHENNKRLTFAEMRNELHNKKSRFRNQLKSLEKSSFSVNYKVIVFGAQEKRESANLNHFTVL